MIDTDKEVEKDEPLLDTLFRRPITKNSSPACSSPSPLCPPPFRNENQTLDWGKNSFDWDNAIGSTGSGLLASTSFGTAEAPIDTESASTTAFNAEIVGLFSPDGELAVQTLAGMIEGGSAKLEINDGRLASKPGSCNSPSLSWDITKPPQKRMLDDLGGENHLSDQRNTKTLPQSSTVTNSNNENGNVGHGNGRQIKFERSFGSGSSSNLSYCTSDSIPSGSMPINKRKVFIVNDIGGDNDKDDSDSNGNINSNNNNGVAYVDFDSFGLRSLSQKSAVWTTNSNIVLLDQDGATEQAQATDLPAQTLPKSRPSSKPPSPPTSSTSLPPSPSQPRPQPQSRPPQKLKKQRPKAKLSQTQGQPEKKTPTKSFEAVMAAEGLVGISSYSSTQSTDPLPPKRNSRKRKMKFDTRAISHTIIPNGLNQKGHWTAQEDNVIKRYVAEHFDPAREFKNWNAITTYLPNRKGKQIRERYKNHLDPNVHTGPYTSKEDESLFINWAAVGNTWVNIALVMNGRSENSLKNRFNSADFQRKFSERITAAKKKMREEKKKKKDQKSGGGKADERKIEGYTAQWSGGEEYLQEAEESNDDSIGDWEVF